MIRLESCTNDQIPLLEEYWLAVDWDLLAKRGQRRRRKARSARGRQEPLDLPGVRPMLQLPLPLRSPAPVKPAVRLICVRISTGRLRVRVIGDAKERRFVQFPEDLRTEGAIYEVDEVKPMLRGKYWRIVGKPRLVRLDAAPQRELQEGAHG